MNWQTVGVVRTGHMGPFMINKNLPLHKLINPMKMSSHDLHKPTHESLTRNVHGIHRTHVSWVACVWAVHFIPCCEKSQSWI